MSTSEYTFDYVTVTSVNFDEHAIMATIEGLKQKANFAMGVQVLTDSNVYCKWDTKTMINTSIINSSDDLTTIQWTEPYSEIQYYLPAARKDMNELATWKWFETAKSNHLRQWVQTYKNVMKGGG